MTQTARRRRLWTELRGVRHRVRRSRLPQSLREHAERSIVQWSLVSVVSVVVSGHGHRHRVRR